jgi:hypothetical protein
MGWPAHEKLCPERYEHVDIQPTGLEGRLATTQGLS